MNRRKRFLVTAFLGIGAVLCLSAAATGLGVFEPQNVVGPGSHATLPEEFERLGAGARTVGEEVTAPQLIEKVQPAYPVDLRAARVDGKVVLHAVIDEQGNVTAVEVLRSSRHEGLDNAAIDAVRQWRYKPATMEGTPVKVHFTVVVNFTVEKAAPDPS